MKKLGLSALLLFFVASVATADITWYTDQGEFEAAAAAAGLMFFELENYEESCTGPPNSVLAVDDPLAPGVPNGPWFPFGLKGVSDMIVQSNLGGGAPDYPNPRGLSGLAAATEGWLGASSDVVLANYFVDSFDMDFDDGAEKPAVGFNTLTFLGGTTVEVRAYGVGEEFLGMTTVNADAAGTYFVGAISNGEIGRVNIHDVVGGAEGADDIQIWIPEPGSLVLLALGGLLIRRR